MLNRIYFLFSFFLVLASFTFLWPLLTYNKIHFGQLGKQTFAAQMIESTSKSELSHGVFPVRHFVEVYHAGLVPWAEEVPLYSFMSSGLMKLTGLSAIMAGKFVSLIAFLLIIFGFARIAQALRKPTWIFIAVAAIYPAFRQYSVQVMPDLCMTAALVFMIDAGLRKQFLRAALFLLMGSLFKYYAIFAGLGLGLYFLSQKKYKDGFILGLAVLPCILYVAWFLSLGVPNPIVDSRAYDGHGHLSSFLNLISYKDWARVVLWWFVKNASIPGTILALVGGVFLFRQSERARTYGICMGIGFILFPVCFISSFYVHDYYGLQGSIGIAILAAYGLSRIFEKNQMLTRVSLVVFLIWSISIVHGMTEINEDFTQIEAFIDRQDANVPGEFALAISGISKPVLSFHAHRDAYIVGCDEWTRELVQKRILDPRIHFAWIHDFKNQRQIVDTIGDELVAKGFRDVTPALILDKTVFRAYRRD